MPGQQGQESEGQARATQWEADRTLEATALPYADRTHYQDEVERQVVLAAAERRNIAKAAGELGMTTDEWAAKRKALGRSPERGDT